jgi:hypothetical protein
VAGVENSRHGHDVAGPGVRLLRPERGSVNDAVVLYRGENVLALAGFAAGVKFYLLVSKTLFHETINTGYA